MKTRYFGHTQECDCAVCDDIDQRESQCSMKIPVTKEFLFSLMHSHSRLSQAEYERNPAYNDSHFSAMAEQALVNDLPPEVVNEYFDYVDSKEK